MLFLIGNRISNAQCSANTGPTQIICKGDAVMIGEAFNTAKAYQWSPDLFINNRYTSNPIVNPPYTITYTLTIVDTNGCTDAASVDIVVQGAYAGDDVIICEGSSVGLTAFGGSTYTWSPVTGLNNPNSRTPIANPNTTTDYTVTITGAGACATSDVVRVTVNSNPTASFTYTGNNECSGFDVNFTGNASGGQAPYSYIWDFGTGDSATAKDTAYKFRAYGCGGTQQFTTTLTVVDANGCTNVYQDNVDVIESPEPILIDQDVFSQFSNCENSPTPANPEFTITVDNATVEDPCVVNYQLDWGDGSPILTINDADFPLTHTYTSLGLYPLVFTATGTNGCVGEKIHLVDNQTNPGVGLSTLGGTAGCMPIEYAFVLSQYEDNSPGTYYVWDFGDGSPQVVWDYNAPYSNDTIFHTYDTTSCNAPNNYFITTVTAYNNCDATQAQVTGIKVWYQPEARYQISSYGCVGQAGYCFANITEEGEYGNSCSQVTGYLWDFGDGTTYEGRNPPCHTYNAEGNYDVTLYAWNLCDTTEYTTTVGVGQAAIIDIEPDTLEGCVDLDVSFTDFSVGTGIIRNWTVNPSTGWSYIAGTNSFSAQPSFRFTQPGNYVVRLILSNACSADTAVFPVRAFGTPILSLDTIGNTCDSLIYTPNIGYFDWGNSMNYYSWTFGGGLPAGSNLEFPSDIRFIGPGQYTVELIAGNSCDTAMIRDTFDIFDKPGLQLIPDTLICNGDSGHINVSALVSGLNYTWREGAVNGPIVGTGNRLSVAPTTDTYYYVYAEEPISGCSEWANIFVEVNIPPNPNFRINNACVGDVINAANTTFVPSGGSQVNAWSWDVYNDGLEDFTTQHIAFIPDSAGIFEVTLNVLDVNGCLSSITKPIEVYALPEFDVVDTVVLCQNDFQDSLVQYVLFDTIGGIWSGPTNISNNWLTNEERQIGRFNAQDLALGFHSFSISGTNIHGCFQEIPLVIEIITPVAIDAGPDTVLCPDDGWYALGDYVSPSGGVWVGSGVIRNVNTYYFNPGNSGSGQFKLHYLVGGASCALADSILIEVREPVAITFDLTEACFGDSNYFNNTSSPTFPISNYNWNFGDGFMGSGENVGHAYSGAGIYNVQLSLIDDYGCVSASPLDSVYIFNQPKHSIIADYFCAPDSACVNDSILIIRNVIPVPFSDSIVNWYWDMDNDGFYDTNKTDSFYYSFNTAGLHRIQLLVETKNGCNDTVEQFIQVSEPPVANYSLDFVADCEEGTLTIIDSSIGLIRDYQWSIFSIEQNGDTNWVFQSNNADPNPIPLISSNNSYPTWFYVMLDASNCCGLSSLIDSVIVYPKPVADFVTNRDRGCTGVEIQFQAQGLVSGTPDYILYNWGDGSAIDTIFPTAVPQPGGDTVYTWDRINHQFYYSGQSADTTYNVQLTAVNNCGDSTSSHPIYVEPNNLKAFFGNTADAACPPMQVTFTDYTGAGGSVFWCFNYDTISNQCLGGTDFGDTVTYVFSQEGTYVIAEMVDDGCSSDTAFATIVVSSVPYPRFRYSIACALDTVNFTNESYVNSGAIVAYSWDFGDGSISSNQHPMHIYQSGGSYLVSLIVYSSNGCSDTISQTIEVDDMPVSDFTANNICWNEQPIQFTNNSSLQSGTIEGMFWDFGDGNVSIDQHPQHTYALAGEYEVALYVESNNGCADTYTRTVRIYPTANSNFSFVTDSLDGCGIPQQVDFTNLSQNSIGFNWDFDAANNPGVFRSTNTHPSFTYNNAGIYDIKLTSQTLYGCVDSVQKQITISAEPVADLLANVLSGCEPLIVNFNDASILVDPNAQITNWYWDLGEGNLSTDTNPTYTYLAGDYDVRLVVESNLGCRDEISFDAYIHVDPVPSAAFVSTGTDKGFFTFTNNSSNGVPPYQYFWDLGNGDSAFTQDVGYQYEVSSLSFGDLYDVCLTVVDSNYCEDTYCEKVLVGNFSLYVPNAMTPERGFGEVRLFLPKGKSLETYLLQVYDTWGNLIWETSEINPVDGSPAKGWDGKSNGELLPQGAYVWRINATFKNGLIWRGQEYENGKFKTTGTINLIR